MYHFFTSDNYESKIDIAFKSLFHPAVGIIASAYVLWDSWNYFAEYANLGGRSNTNVKITSSGEKIIEGLEKRIKELPNKLDFYITRTSDSEKIYDKLDEFNLENGYAIFKNTNNIINGDNYLKADQVSKIRNYLGIGNNDYFDVKRLTHNKVKLIFKDPFGVVRFKREDLKEGHILVGYTEELKPYYISIDKLTFMATLGVTGSGKSVNINGKIISVVYNEKYFENIEFIDLKGTELDKYDGLLNGKIKVGTSVDNYCALIEKVYDEMERRVDLSKKEGFEFSVFKPWYVLVDEYGSKTITFEACRDVETRRYYNSITEKEEKIFTKGRSAGIFFDLYSQRGTVDHYPATIREMCITKSLLKTSGFYEAFIDDKKLQELGKNPDFFNIGTFLYRDGTETNIKGDNYVFMKSVLVQPENIVSVLPEEDKYKYTSVMFGQKRLMEIRGIIENNKKTRDRYAELVEAFSNPENMKYVNPELVDKYFIRNKIDKQYFMSKQIIEKNYSDEFMTEINLFLEYSNSLNNKEAYITKYNEIIEYGMSLDKATEEDLNKVKSMINEFKTMYKPLEETFQTKTIRRVKKELPNIKLTKEEREDVETLIKNSARTDLTEEDKQDLEEEVETIIREIKTPELEIDKSEGDNDIEKLKEEIKLYIKTLSVDVLPKGLSFQKSVKKFKGYNTLNEAFEDFKRSL
jgi:hypothetical protein